MSDIHLRDTGSAELDRILAERKRIHAAWGKPRRRMPPIPPLPPQNMKSLRERFAEADKLRGIVSANVIKDIKYNIRQSAIDFGEIHTPGPACTTINKIQCVVAEYFGVGLDQMLSGRLGSMVLPRQIAMYLAKSLTRRSLHEIGRRFCDRDHATVIYAVQKIERLIMADGALGAKITALKEMLMAE